MNTPNGSSPPAPLRWPKIALACVVLFFAACTLWMWKEVRRVQRIRRDTEEQRRPSQTGTNATVDRHGTNRGAWIRTELDEADLVARQSVFSPDPRFLG